MIKTLRVAWREYRRHVFRWRFLLALFSIPAVLLMAVAAFMVLFAVSYDPRPIGVVDQSGWLDKPVFPPRENEGFTTDLEIRLYPDELTARKELDDETLQAYFLIHPDYLDSGRVTMVALEAPSETADTEFTTFLKHNLVSNLPPDAAQRILEGEVIKVQSIDGSRETKGFVLFQLLAPAAVGFLIIMIMNFTGSYLMQALVEEKENRTLEIILTSLSPGQLISGKIFGSLAVGLTQFVFWGFLPGVMAMLVLPLLPVEMRPEIGSDFAVLSILAAIPALLMYGAIMVVVGATAAERTEAQQISGFVALPFSIPFFLFNSIMLNPNGPVSIALSLIPFTAPVTLPIRAAFTNIPLWQSVTSICLLWLVAVLCVWLAGRAFRLGMLSLGRAVTVKELLGIKKRGRHE